MKQPVGEASPARRADQPPSAGNPSRAGKPPWPRGRLGATAGSPGRGSRFSTARPPRAAPRQPALQQAIWVAQIFTGEK